MQSCGNPNQTTYNPTSMLAPSQRFLILASCSVCCTNEALIQQLTFALPFALLHKSAGSAGQLAISGCRQPSLDGSLARGCLPALYVRQASALTVLSYGFVVPPTRAHGSYPQSQGTRGKSSSSTMQETVPVCPCRKSYKTSFPSKLQLPLWASSLSPFPPS
jgi:hypothetical protein